MSTAAETMRLRSENKQLRDDLDQMRRARDRALIEASLHVCYGSERDAAPVADNPKET